MLVKTVRLSSVGVSKKKVQKKSNIFTQDRDITVWMRDDKKFMKELLYINAITKDLRAKGLY